VNREPADPWVFHKPTALKSDELGANFVGPVIKLLPLKISAFRIALAYEVSRAATSYTANARLVFDSRPGDVALARCEDVSSIWYMRFLPPESHVRDAT
jgi:hypothetical protein